MSTIKISETIETVESVDAVQPPKVVGPVDRASARDVASSNNVFSKLLQQLWLVVGSANIRVKILGIVLGLVLLLGFTVTIQVRQLVSQSMYTQLHPPDLSLFVGH
ncbi:MAG: hypothetical protein ABI670_21820 [Chloroflexota bacterium]